MSDAADRLARFEAWAKAKRPALRAQDRRKVALELFEMVGDEVVLKLDVEHLMKRYREGLLGAQAVLLVRKVGEDVLAWQEAELAARRAERERDDDGDRDEEVEPARDHDERDLDDDWERDERDDDERDRDDDDEREHDHDERDDEPDEQRVEKQAPAAPARARASGRDGVDADADLEEDAKAVLNRWTFEEEESHSAPKSSRANEWDETSDISTVWRDKSGVATVSKRLRREEDEAGADVVDAEGAAGRGPESRPPGSRPPTSSQSVPPASARPLTRPPPKADAGPLRASTIAGIGLGVLVVLLFVLGLRRGWFSAPKDESVAGDFASPHLHATMRFKEGWTHVRARDKSETERDGWVRRESFFFQGTSPTEFERTLTVLSLEAAKAATEADLRELGPRHLAPDAVLRHCVPLADGRVGTRCESVSGGTYPTLEEFFVSGSRVVFLRGVVSPAVIERERASGDTRPFASLDEIANSVTPSR